MAVHSFPSVLVLMTAPKPAKILLTKSSTLGCQNPVLISCIGGPNSGLSIHLQIPLAKNMNESSARRSGFFMSLSGSS